MLSQEERQELILENLELKKILIKIDKFLTECDVQTAAEDREIGRLQQSIRRLV
jgi:hypothetical protein